MIQSRCYFANAPILVVKKTWECGTKFGRTMNQYPMKKHYHSRFPALNVPHWNEDVAMDTFKANVPTYKNGSTMAQIYVGVTSQCTYAFGMKSQSEIADTLEDLIHREGAMNHLRGDNTKAQIGKRILQIECLYSVDTWMSEPYHQHQNYVECGTQEIKKLVNHIIDHTGCPATMWLLVLLYVCYLWNHMAAENLDWRIRLEVKTGQPVDISILLHHAFWDDVMFSSIDKSFPSKSPEEPGKIVGIAEHCGDALTWLVLSTATGEILPRSAV